MIFTFIMSILFLPIKLVLGILPKVETIPYIDEGLVTGIGYFRVFADFFPPFYTMLTLFGAWLIIKSSLMIAKFFLGNRLPTLQ